MKKPFQAAAKAGKRNAEIDQLEAIDPAKALHAYAERGDIENLRRLLQTGLDPDEIIHIHTSIETMKDSALYAAAGAGHMAVAKELIAGGATIDIVLDDGYTPLLHAAMNGWPNMVQLLLENNADVNRRETLGGQTALHWASRTGRPETVKLLLKAGADALIADKSGQTAEDMICKQFSGSHPEREELYDAIQGAFNIARAAKKQAAELEAERHAQHARDIAEMPVLKNDVKVGKPVTFKRRAP